MKLPKEKLIIYIIFGFSFLAGLMFFIPYTVKKPDGFNKEVKETMAFLKKEDFQKHEYSPRHDYTIEEIEHKRDPRVFGSIVGVFVVFALLIVAAFILRKRRRNL